MVRPGRVSLVGAGPGDPDLITVKGLRLLRRAEVVVYDRLVATALLDRAPATARRIFVGKSPGDHPWPQARINRLLVAEARRGRRVVRLKGGDPFVFGRGGEECDALRAACVPYEVVPGISSAIAAPSAAGIPVTHRALTGEFAVVTGHDSGEGAVAPDWSALARIRSIVVLMGVAELPRIVERLLAHGRCGSTPVAVIAAATTARQRVVRGTISTIAVRAASVRAPATIVIGDVAALADADRIAQAAARSTRLPAAPEEVA